MSHTASAQPSPQPSQPKGPAPRRWWEKQRWIIVIAAVVLGLAVLAVIMFLRADVQAPTAAEAGVTPTAEPSSPGASDPARAGASEPGTGPADGEPQDQRLAQVCDRIIAFQQDLRSGGIEPLSAMSELSEIERQARGTRLDDQVDAVGNTVQDFFLGQANADEVIAAGSELATAC